MLLIKFQLSSIIVFGVDFQNMNSQHFLHIKCIGTIQMHGEASLNRRKKVKRQRRTIILAILVDLPFTMIYAITKHAYIILTPLNPTFI